MRALIVGSGAREHSLAWKLSREGWDVVSAPGSPGMAACSEVRSEAKPSDAEALVALAEEVLPDLVVIGPEAPLIAGAADYLRAAGFNVFGPGREGARLEGSKAWSKAVMAEAGVPTAGFAVFDAPGLALEHIASVYDQGRSVAVKASGAALGKGVFVCPSLAEAEDAVNRLMVAAEAGEAGATIVVEERLTGREFSLLTLVSESGTWSLPVAQDHKRAFDGDRGPNTGGMGAYSPVGWISPALVEEAERTIARPAIARLAEMGIPFRGCLFSGVMMDGDRPMCLEYNVRFGDPECQTVLRLLGEGFGESLLACAKGAPPLPVCVTSEACVCITVASGGYPGKVRSGLPISIGALPEGVEVFHAGTSTDADGRLVTAGGRVLSVTAVADGLQEAKGLAYGAAELIRFEGAFYRSDIASGAERDH